MKLAVGMSIAVVCLSAGIATAVVNYRLTPEVQHPGHVEDAAASFARVKRHIAEYGGSGDQVFIIGHSAGAYLVALLHQRITSTDACLRR